MKKEDFPIDIVIPWVDGSDELWLKEKNKYSSSENSSIEAQIMRYRDWRLMRYWFRGIEKFAPWVRKIHFITWGHLPNWLDTSHPKLHIVNHKDYIPDKWLPTFSANPIELNFHRIKDLSEHFIYFNDDMFLIKPINKSNFYRKGKPCVMFRLSALSGDYNDPFKHILLNDSAIINRHFSFKTFKKQQIPLWLNYRYSVINNLLNLILIIMKPNMPTLMSFHLPQAMLKSTFEEVWIKETTYLEKVSSNKFRTYGIDINQYIFTYWDIFCGRAAPIDLNKIGMYYDLQNKAEEAAAVIMKQKYRMVCLNDTVESEFEHKRQLLSVAFESILPEKSSYEKTSK
jgi:hypothetical protein